MARWTDLELAERIAQNSSLRLKRELGPRSLSTVPTREMATTPVSRETRQKEAAKPRKAPYSISEADLLSWVLEFAKLKGWLCAHFRPAKTSKGWRTAVSADGAGFPDLVMVRKDRCLFVELKAERGKLSENQQIWLGFLTGANQHGRVYVWKPSDWLDGTIERTLK